MSGFQLILSSDTIEQGRIKINNAFSATTGLWSGSTGTQSLIHNNETGNLAIGYYAIASGSGTTANGLISFATNKDTIAYGDFSHAEGEGTYAGGLTSHAEGFDTTASGDYSHSEGGSTTAFGENSHAEGYRSYASGNTSHAEGGVTTSVGIYSHSEGVQTIAYGANSHAEGNGSQATGNTSHAEGYQTKAWGNYSHTEGNATTAIGLNSHAEGNLSKATGNTSHAEGYLTIAGGSLSHAEGNGSQATGNTSHAEGFETRAWGDYSHAEGYQTTALSIYSHSEGRITIASGNTSHAEGVFTIAGGSYSHAGGVGLSTARVIADGYGSFAHFRRTSTTSTIGALADNSAILGGYNHSIDSTSDSSYIIGGDGGVINAVSLNSGVIGGYSNAIYGSDYCTIIGGHENLINNGGPSNLILGGSNNTISSGFFDGDSIIFGGNNNTITGGQNYMFGMGASTKTSLNSGTKQVVFGGNGGNTIIFDIYNGSGYWDGTVNLGAADYAEYFEWKDSNLKNEERFGYFVSLIQDKIEIGNKNILGIVSIKPAILGDSGFLNWNNRFLQDEWGRDVLEVYKKYKINLEDKNIEIFIDEKNNIYIEVPSLKNILGILYNENIDNKEFLENISFPKVNPKYNPSIEYISREDRPEWSPVGLLGKLRVRTSEKITSNKISADKNGMAINGTDYHVLKTIKEFDGDYGIVQVLFK